MTITIKTKNLEFGKQTKLKIEGKLKKIEKLFSSDAAAVVKVAQEKAGYKVEITAPISNRTVRAEVVADDMMAAIEKGYEQATKSWGEELPEISKKTLEATREKINAWKNANSVTSTQA